METLPSSTFARVQDPLLDLPIRDGNRWLGASHIPRCRLLDLPIRDGNTVWSGVYKRWDLLLDLPIRDGNRAVDKHIAAVSEPFRPSYQGWKLTRLAAQAEPRYTFRPSYQGWKRKFDQPSF